MTNYQNAFQGQGQNLGNYDQRYDIVYQTTPCQYQCIPSFLVVDSMYRDSPSTSTPADYAVTFIKKYPDVTSVELVYANIPNSNYNITDSSKNLHMMATTVGTNPGKITKITFSGSAGTPGFAGSTTSAGDFVGGTTVDDATFTIGARDASGNLTTISIADGGSGYMYNDTLVFTNGGAVITITVTETTVTTIALTPGLYTAATLTAHVQDQLNANLAGPLWEVNIITAADAEYKDGTRALDILRIAADDNFALKNSGGTINEGTAYATQPYNTDSVAKVLGFTPRDVASSALSARYAIYSNYPIALEMDHYIAMFIEDMERCDSNVSAIQNSYCIVPLDATQENFGLFKDSNNIDNDKFKFHFIQPRKLAKLKISFKDWAGNPYDFRGLNHTLVFKIETSTHKRKLVVPTHKHKHRHHN